MFLDTVVKKLRRWEKREQIASLKRIIKLTKKIASIRRSTERRMATFLKATYSGKTVESITYDRRKV